MSKYVRRSLVAALALALSAPAFAGQVHTAGLTESGSFDRFIVKFANGTPEAKDASARQHAFDGLGNAEGVGLAHQLRLAVGADVVRSSRKLDRARAEKLMRRLASHPDVEYVEVDKLNKPFGTPNDTSYSQQWGFFSATAGIRADQAWDLGNGAGVVVAVLDTGITNHSDLNANVIAGYDFIKDVTMANDGNGRDADAHDPGDWAPAGACDAGSPAESSSWHGTHVAGTIAAVTNNAKGVAGTAGGAKIMPLRVLGRCGGYTSDISDAIIWASGGSVSGLPVNPNPAEVISLSLGGTGACTATEQAAINSAVSRGTTVVVAAGNENANVSTSSPANCQNVIAVGAITSTGQRASFSNYGAGVDVAAPGYNILSTINKGTQGPGAEGYASYSGTSMATPHVSGVVALMQSYATTPKTPAQIEALLKSSARAFPVAVTKPIGAGIVDARAAMVAARSGTTTPPANVAPVANFSVATSGLTASFTDKSTDSDGSIASRSWTFGDGSSSTSASPSHTYAAAGTYTVTETVKDNAGASNSKSASVTVSSGSTGGTTGGTVLASGVAVTLPAKTTGTWSSTYTMTVPAGRSTLTFTTAGGTGDADLYVRFGTAPTATYYDCRPYKTGNAETCTFNAPKAGTWYVKVRAYQAYSGVSLKGSY